MPYPVDKEKPFLLEKEKSALLIIDMQNDFVRQGAALEVPEARDTIDTHQRLISFFRESSLPIIYTKFITGPEYTLMWEWSPMCGPELKTCWEAVKKSYQDGKEKLDGSDIIDELYPETGDHIIRKYGYNSFYNTILEDLLRNNRIEYLVVTGTVTHVCVADTVKGAFHRQFKCVVAEDAVSSYSEKLHEASLEILKLKYGRVESTETIINELKLPQN